MSKDEEAAAKEVGIEWLNNRLDILSAETLKNIKDKTEGLNAEQDPNSKHAYTDSEKTILTYWIELNKQRYANTSYHIHFSLDKVHDSFKVFMQLFIALAAFIVAVFSGKFGTWIMPNQIIDAKYSMYIFLGAMFLAFSAYLFFWSNKWGQFRNLEHEIFGGFLKDYDKLDAGDKSSYPLILIVIIFSCCVAMALGLNQLVDESKTEDVEGLVCLRNYYECGLDNESMCRDQLKICLKDEVAKFDTR
ncbi:hypothetical protein [Alteromonas gracilis]|uniref:hypothetical protein n=1 Tax=Alteromonas gracilis TaxID=1479524 RepID=UPI00373594CA